MRRDPRVTGLVLALVGAISGCEDDSGSAARLSPAVVWVGDQTGRFRIEGPNPVDYLRGDGHEVRLVDDYAATIGGVPTQVVSVDGLGVDVTLTTSLPTGVFPLAITAGARTWRTEAALTVVADPIDSDAGLCPLAPDGCTAFTCPTSDRCYYLCGEREWSSASNQCPALGLGCLVTIGDQAEQDCVAAALGREDAETAWIGWRQDAAAEEPAEGWGWDCPDGSDYRPASWGDAEPDDDDGEDCGALGRDGAWRDRGCEERRRYVCER